MIARVRKTCTTIRLNRSEWAALGNLLCGWALSPREEQRVAKMAEELVRHRVRDVTEAGLITEARERANETALSQTGREILAFLRGRAAVAANRAGRLNRPI